VQLVGVLVGQVDLVGAAFQCEGHGAYRLRAVQVVDEPLSAKIT
jgi:hypothetical protein